MNASPTAWNFRPWKWLFALSLSMAFTTITSHANGPTLTLQVKCLKSTSGQVRFALFDSKGRHLKTSVQSKIVSVGNEPVVWRITDLPAGNFSLAAYHDRNGNGRLDRGVFGLPAEPYGFSNGVRIRFGPPSWKATSFAFGDEDLLMEVCLK